MDFEETEVDSSANFFHSTIRYCLEILEFSMSDFNFSKIFQSLVTLDPEE